MTSRDEYFDSATLSWEDKYDEVYPAGDPEYDSGDTDGDNDRDAVTYFELEEWEDEEDRFHDELVDAEMAIQRDNNARNARRVKSK